MGWARNGVGRWRKMRKKRRRDDTVAQPKLAMTSSLKTKEKIGKSLSSAKEKLRGPFWCK